MTLFQSFTVNQTGNSFWLRDQSHKTVNLAQVILIRMASWDLSKGHPLVSQPYYNRCSPSVDVTEPQTMSFTSS